MEGCQSMDDKVTVVLVIDRAYRDEAWTGNGEKVAEVLCSTIKKALSRNL